MALSRALRLSILHYTPFVKNGINSFWQTRNTSVLFSVTTLRCPYKKPCSDDGRKQTMYCFPFFAKQFYPKGHHCLNLSNEPTNSFPLESSSYKYLPEHYFTRNQNVQCTKAVEQTVDSYLKYLKYSEESSWIHKFLKENHES